MYWKEGEEKLHNYIIFVTLYSLVHEQILSNQPDKDDYKNWKQILQVFKIKKKSFIYKEEYFFPNLTLIS